ncbi:hypothetical protein ABZZ20_33945 [Streptomyces sp. NPDC006430]|uniref:acyl-CoA carboxylase epsilon subunit n=1 Tax=Streptomyces sp. NPDC006430 TaxID=3154299 RepID=UPI0033BC81C4
MTIAEERLLTTELAPQPAYPPTPAVRVLPVPEPEPPAAPTAPAAPAAPAVPPRAAAEDGSAVLALASIRITKGSPTAEEAAALAVLLASRLRLLQAGSFPPASGPRKLPQGHQPPFRAPGAWVS